VSQNSVEPKAQDDLVSGLRDICRGC